MIILELLGLSLLVGLVGFRLWRIVAVDSILDTVRERVLVRAPEWLSELVYCAWCLGWWITGLLALLVVGLGFGLVWWQVLLVWPMASVVTGLLAKVDQF